MIETVDNYDRAIAAIKSDIEKWYQRFADNNEISLAEAKKLLTKAELEEFKWTVDDYIKLGMSGDPRWHKQLENASARVHLNRLEALEIQMREQVERIYRGRETATREYLANLYEDNYYHNVFDIEQGVGIGLSFTRLDQKRLDLVTQKPWTTDNKTFSDRIWTSKQALINSLNRNLTQMIARGEAPDRTIAAIAKEFEKDKNTVGRLVMTESAAFSAKARADAYSELGVERFKIVATLDAKTSEICQDMDGKHFAEKDREIGVTCPPFHPWCRSTDVPYFDDEFTVGSLRVARDPNTGKIYEVPANMTYEEWAQQRLSKLEVSDTVQPYAQELSDFSDIYNRNRSDRLTFAREVFRNQGLTVPVDLADIHPSFGLCAFDPRSRDMDLMYCQLLRGDNRQDEYKIKTIFHELYHAKSDGLAHGMRVGNSTDRLKYGRVEETFAESAAHYMTKGIGITHEIAPLYSSLLVEYLPKLKSFPKFKDCSTISDFGREAMSYRFGPKSRANWMTFYNRVDAVPLDLVQYTQSHYLSYIKNNREELVDKWIETMPHNAPHKARILTDLDSGVTLIESGRYPASGNEKIAFDSILAITMNRLGVK